MVKSIIYQQYYPLRNSKIMLLLLSFLTDVTSHESKLSILPSHLILKDDNSDNSIFIFLHLFL